MKNDFDINTPQSSYALGFIFGDGWISKPNKNYYQIMITIKEEDSIYLNQIFYDFTRRKIVEKYGRRKDQIRYVLSNKNTVNFLNGLGFDNKNCYIDNRIMQHVNGNEVYFFRGLFDADGGIYRISTRPKELISDFASNKNFDWSNLTKFLKRNNIAYNIYRETSKKTGFSRSIVRMNKSNTMKLIPLLYNTYESDCMGYKRKWLKYKDYLNEHDVVVGV